MAIALLGVASAAMSGMAAQQQAQAQRNYQQQLAIQQRDQNYEEQVTARQQEAMKQEELAREAFGAQLENKRNVATALTSAAGAGVSGASVDALISDYNTQYAMNLAALHRQQELTSIVSNQNVANVAKDQYIQAPVESPSMGSILGSSILGNIGGLL